MHDITVRSLVALAAGNEVTNGGVISALDLEKLAAFGLTFGAWFKIGLFVALVLLICERAFSVHKACRRAVRKKRRIGDKEQL